MEANTGKLEFSQDTVGWRRAMWRNVLQDIALQPHAQILEIGTFEGQTLVWLLTEVFKPGAVRADVIDPFVGGTESVLRGNIASAGLTEQVTVFNGDSNRVLRTLSGPYDLIYVDGCHCARHVLADAVLAWDLLKVDGLMVFDDYEYDQTASFKNIPQLDSRNSPRIAIDAFLNCFDRELEVVQKAYEVVVRKTGPVHD